MAINPNIYPEKQLADMIEAGRFTLDYLQQTSQEISVPLNALKANKVKAILDHRKEKLGEGTDWEKASTDNSIESYTQFLQRHPTSAHKAEAEAQLHSLREQKIKDDYQRVTSIGATKAEMQQFVDNYPDTKEGQEIQEKIWSLCVTIADYEDFGQRNPNSPHCSDIQAIVQKLRLMQQTQDENAWNEAKASGSMQKIREYVQQYSIHRTEAYMLIDNFDDRAWMQIKDSGEIADFESYLDEYSKDGRLPRHKQEAENKKHAIEEEKKNEPLIIEEINHVLANPYKDVCDYLELCRKYPSKKKEIKEWMLNDMKLTPGRYQRDEMYQLMFKDGEYLTEPLFSPQEIISSGVLSIDRVNWIKDKPKKEYDDSNEVLPKETCFDTEKNNTDIFFFGVPGSGKTSVLAGLLSVVNIGGGYKFKYLSTGCMHVGYNYAVNLVSAVNNHVFPARTRISNLTDSIPSSEGAGAQQPAIGIGIGDGGGDGGGIGIGIGNTAEPKPVEPVKQESNADEDLFIQIIDAKIQDEKTGSENKISIVEMPGERTLRFAAAKSDDMKMLGEGTAKLFNNDNDKVVFFIIDPNDKKTNEVNINGSYVKVTQAQALTAVADFLEDMVKKGKLKNLKSVHVIMSKSDLIRLKDDYGTTISMKESIDNIMHKSDYQSLVSSLTSICNKAIGDVNIHCGRRPKLFTFTLGRILPGDMFDYDAEDSRKILRVIKANTQGVGAPTAWDTICSVANKKLNELI